MNAIGLQNFILVLIESVSLLFQIYSLNLKKGSSPTSVSLEQGGIFQKNPGLKGGLIRIQIIASQWTDLGGSRS